MTDVDIFVRDHPLHLRDSAEDIYQDYAVQNSEIFIGEDLHRLLQNPDFEVARDAAFGGREHTPEFMDIRVTAEGYVLVRATPRDHWIDTHFNHADAQVKAIASKTQKAWELYKSSQESSRESSPASVHSPSPLRDRHVVHEYGPPPRELTERLQALESENRELRSRLDNMELRGQLDRTSRLLDAAKAELRESREENSALSDQVDALQYQIGELQRRQDQTNQALNGAVALGLVLFAALAEQGQLTHEQRQEVEALRKDNAELQAGLVDQHEQIEEMTEANRALQDQLSQAIGSARLINEAREKLEQALRAANDELETLRPENAAQKRALAEAQKQLHSIEDAISRGIRPSESIPEAIKRLISTAHEFQGRIGGLIEELQLKGQEYDTAMRKQQEALTTVGRTLGTQINSIEDLPEAVSQAVREARGREEVLQLKLSTEEEATQAASEARDDFQEQLLVAQKELEQLRPENARQKDDLARALEQLQAIEAAAKKGKTPHESLPQMITRFIDTIARLEESLADQGRKLQEKGEEYDTAMREQQKALAAVGHSLGTPVNSIEELSGAVSKALQEAKEREAELSHRVIQVESERDGERELVVQERGTSEKLREQLLDQQRARQLEVAALRGELETAQGRIATLQKAAERTAARHQEQVRGMQADIDKKERLLAKQQETSRDLRSQLAAATSDLEAEQRKTASQTSDLSRLSERVEFLKSQLEKAGAQEAQLRKELSSTKVSLQEKTALAQDQAATITDQEEALRAAAKKSEGLSDELQQARKELEAATLKHAQESKRQAATIASLEERIKGFQRRLDESASREQALIIQVGDLETQVRAAKREARASKLDLEIATGNLSALEERKEAQRIRLNGRIDELNKQLIAAKAESTRLAIQNSDIRSAHLKEVLPLQAKVEELEEALRKAEEEAQATDLGSVQLREELDQAKAQQQENLRANADLTEELETLKEEKARLEGLLGAIDQYERENAHLRTESRSLADELAELGESGPAFAKLPENIKALVESLKRQIRELKQEKQVLVAKQEAIVELHAELEDERRKTSFAQEKIERLEAKLATQEEDLAEIEKAHEAKRSKQSATLTQLRTTLRKEREEAAATIESKKEEIRDLENTNQEQERTIRRLEARIRELDGQLEKTEALLQEKREDYTLLEKKFTALEATQRALVQELRKLEKEKEYFEGSATEWEAQYQKKRVQAEELGRELRDVRLALESIESENRALREENKRLFAILNEQLGGGIHTPEDAEYALKALQQKHVKALRQKDLDLAERQEQIDTLTRTVSRTEARRRKMEEARDAARQEAERTSNSLHLQHQLNRELQGQLQTVTKSHASLVDQLGSARATIDQQSKVIGGNAELMERLRKERSEMEVLLDQVREEAAQSKGPKAPEVAETYSLFQAVFGEDSDGFDLSDLTPEEREIFNNLWRFLRSENPETDQVSETSSALSQKIEAKPTILTSFVDFAPFLDAVLKINNVRKSREFAALERERNPAKKKALRLAITKKILQEIKGALGPGTTLSRFSAQGFGFHLKVLKEALDGLDTTDYKAQTAQKAQQYRNIATLLTGTFQMMFQAAK